MRPKSIWGALAGASVIVLAPVVLSSCSTPSSLAVEAIARDWRLGDTTLSVDSDGTFEVAGLPSDVLDGVDVSSLSAEVSGSGVWTVEDTESTDSRMLHLQLADVASSPIDMWFDFAYDEWNGYELTMVREPGLTQFQLH